MGFEAMPGVFLLARGGARAHNTTHPTQQNTPHKRKRLLVSRDTDAVVRKKAALCLLKLFRTNPDNVTHPEWAPQV